MPATNFIWSLQDSAAIFHTIGMKRKCPENEVPLSKRPCPSSLSGKCNGGIAMDPESNMNCDGDNERSSMDMECNSYSKENRVPDLHPNFPVHMIPNERCCDLNSNSLTNRISQGPEQDIEDNNNNSCNTNGASVDMCYQNTMIMDLQDECYSTAVLPENVMTDAEYEAACNMAAMESEGAPDPSQYRYSHVNSSTLCTLQDSPTNENTTIVSTTSLSPEIRPYVSDYY